MDYERILRKHHERVECAKRHADFLRCDNIVGRPAFYSLEGNSVLYSKPAGERADLIWAGNARKILKQLRRVIKRSWEVGQRFGVSSLCEVYFCGSTNTVTITSFDSSITLEDEERFLKSLSQGLPFNYWNLALVPILLAITAFVIRPELIWKDFEDLGSVRQIEKVSAGLSKVRFTELGKSESLSDLHAVFALPDLSEQMIIFDDRIYRPTDMISIDGIGGMIFKISHDSITLLSRFGPESSQWSTENIKLPKLKNQTRNLPNLITVFPKGQNAQQLLASISRLQWEALVRIPDGHISGTWRSASLADWMTELEDGLGITFNGRSIEVNASPKFRAEINTPGAWWYNGKPNDFIVRTSDRLGLNLIGSACDHKSVEVEIGTLDQMLFDLGIDFEVQGDTIFVLEDTSCEKLHPDGF